MYNVAIVGATGLVGTTFLKVLAEYQFPIKKLKLLASSRSAGNVIEYQGQKLVVEELNANSFIDVDIALFSAGGEVSRQYAVIAEASGALVIDNSSCWRQDPTKALVVPEVNIEDAKISRIIANPNCSTIQSIIPLKALDLKYGLKRVNFSTYQAVSGSGMKGKNDLKRTLEGENPQFYPHNISQTCIPEIDSMIDNGYTKEEMKMVYETRKMLHLPNLLVSATCVRVPVMNGHAVSMLVELDKPFELDDIKKVLADYPGIVLVDDLANHQYPTSLLANDTDKVYVGRIRRDLSSENGLLIYVVGDNIRKGAAGNAVQIAIAMHERGWIKKVQKC